MSKNFYIVEKDPKIRVCSVSIEDKLRLEFRRTLNLSRGIKPVDAKNNNHRILGVLK
jgi:hypothetical protein